MEGHSVLAHVHKFLPYFFVPAQPGFKEDHCQQFRASALWVTWPRGYKTFFMLNTTEHKISTAHERYNTGK